MRAQVFPFDPDRVNVIVDEAQRKLVLLSRSDHRVVAKVVEL